MWPSSHSHFATLPTREGGKAGTETTLKERRREGDREGKWNEKEDKEEKEVTFKQAKIAFENLVDNMEEEKKKQFVELPVFCHTS